MCLFYHFYMKSKLLDLIFETESQLSTFFAFFTHSSIDQ